MLERLSPAARNITLVVVFVLIAWFLWIVRSVLNPLILAYLLAFVVHPLVLRLEKRGWRRRKAVNLIFGAFFLGATLIGIGIYFQARGLQRELMKEDGVGAKLSERIDQALKDHREEIHWLLDLLPVDSSLRQTLENDANATKSPQDGDQSSPVGETGRTVATDPNTSTVEVAEGAEGATGAEGAAGAEGADDLQRDDIARWFKSWSESWFTDEHMAQAGEVGMSVAGTTFSIGKRFFGGFFQLLTLLVLLPLYTYFLLFELERIHGFVRRYFPRRDRERLTRIATQIGEVLANFLRGRLLVCLAKGALIAVGLRIAGVDFSLLLGLGTGFLSLIPFVGSAVGFVMALLIAMLDNTLLGALTRTGIVFFVAEMFENYILIPKILGDSLGLHPIVVIFSLMAGAASMGMFGLLIALPLTATLVILAREFLLPVLAELADRDGPTRPPLLPPP